MKDYFIFARSGEQYGMGHLSRMLNLSLELVRQGARVGIITNEVSLPFLPERNVSSSLYNDRMHSASDMIRHTLGMRRSDEPAVLVLDDRFVTTQHLIDALHPFWVVVIDNTEKDFASYSDLCIMPNAHMSRADIEYLQTLYGTKDLLYGQDYILTGTMQSGNVKFAKKEDVTYISFAAGGSDPNNDLSLMAKYSNSLPSKIGRVYLAGSLSKKEQYRHFDYQEFSPDLVRMSSLHVCMWGVGMYEALSYGVPVLALLRNKEDIPRAEALNKNSGGALEFLAPGFSHLDLHRVILGSLQSTEWLRTRSKRGRNFVDGQGAVRIAAELIGRFQ